MSSAQVYYVIFTSILVGITTSQKSVQGLAAEQDSIPWQRRLSHLVKCFLTHDSARHAPGSHFPTAPMLPPRLCLTDHVRSPQEISFAECIRIEQQNCSEGLDLVSTSISTQPHHQKCSSSTTSVRAPGELVYHV